jgi:hypothetical protein
MMRSRLGAAIDRRLAELIIVRLRRAWPLLKLVPASWVFPIVAPGARRLRRSLSRGAVALAVSAGALLVLFALRTRPGAQQTLFDQVRSAASGVRRCSGVRPRLPAGSTIWIMRRQ